MTFINEAEAKAFQDGYYSRRQFMPGGRFTKDLILCKETGDFFPTTEKCCGGRHTKLASDFTLPMCPVSIILQLSFLSGYTLSANSVKVLMAMGRVGTDD